MDKATHSYIWFSDLDTIIIILSNVDTIDGKLGALFNVGPLC